MPTVTRLGLPILALLSCLVAACQSIPEAGSLVPIIGGAPFVTVTTRGGECPDGPCGNTTVIERDGKVHQTVPVAVDLGQVPAGILTALDAAIKTTDFDLIRAVAFDAECPVNFDGQEFIYEFGTPGGTERIASCETMIDPSHPVFAAVTAALDAVDVPPAP